MEGHRPPDAGRLSFLIMSSPRVSVLMTCYNYGRFLHDAVTSVQKQTYPPGDVEILVVDDGSTDETRQVAGRFGTSIRYLYQTHQGQAQAFNTGIREAQGRWVLLLDADDVWHPEKIARVVTAFEAHPEAGLVQHRMIDTRSEAIATLFDPGLTQGQRQDYHHFLDGRLRFTGTSGLSFQKELLRDLGPVPAALIFCADEYLYTHGVLRRPVFTIDNPLGRRRLHGTNWYAASWGSLERLRARHEIRLLLDRSLDNELAARQWRFADSVQRERLFESLREEVFLAALQKKNAEARRRFQEGMGQMPSTGYWRFKSWTLWLATVSPGMYLFFQNIYSRLTTLVQWRQKSLPDV